MAKNKKHLRVFFFLLTAFFIPLLSTPSLAKYAALVIDATTGQVLHQENADKKTYPASLTKMMTLYETFLALDQKRLSMDDALIVSAHAERQAPSKLGLKKGQKILVKDAIKGLVTKSANDAAVVLAEALSNTETNFAARITKRAHQLGMVNTSFRNASGLPNPYQVTTARDMAILSRALIKHFPHYYHHFATKLFNYKGTTYSNHNHLVGKVIAYKDNHPIVVDGIKTGFIIASGFNLAASARYKNHRVIGVVMGGESYRWRDERMEFLLAKSFQAVPSARFTLASQALENLAPKSKYSSLKRLSKTTKIKEKASTKERRLLKATHTPETKKWLVQVGAFKHPRSAQNMLLQAKKKAGNLLRSAKAITQPAGKKKGLFQARFTNLTFAGAQQSCSTLKKAGISCMISRI